MLHLGAFPSVPGSWLRQGPLHCEHSEVEGTPPPPWLNSEISITAPIEAAGASVLAQRELGAQASSSNQTWPTIPSAQDFSVVTKTPPNESPGIQMSPADTWLGNRQNYTQLFLTGQLHKTAEE